MRKDILWVPLCLLITAGFIACVNSESANSTGANLRSISISPANPSLANGLTQQFTAVGTYSDGTSNDITASTTWSSSNTGIATVSNGLAIAVAPGVTTITATSGAVSDSTALAVTATLPAPGVNWTTACPGYPSLRGVAWSGSQFVAAGDSGTILTSPDGVAWTARASGATHDLKGIAWSGTQFAAVGDSGMILTSPDGIAWTARASGTTYRLNGIVWSGTQFVAVGEWGIILTSQ